MSDASLFLIFAPLLAIGGFIAYMARNDREANRSAEQNAWPILNGIYAVFSCVAVVVVVLVFLNNLFGAFLLTAGGAVLLIQGRMFNDIGWLKGGGARIYGGVWAVVGTLLLVVHLR